MLLIGNNWVDAGRHLDVINPASDERVGTVAEADPAHVGQALQAARTALGAPRSAYRRAQLLHAAADRIADERESIARLIMAESGKAIRECRVEVDRSVMTARFSAEEALRLHGEVLPCDITEQEIARHAVAIRVPVGVVAAITPFNFPINVLMHKLAPALAGGNAVIVKPSPRTPLTANRVGELFVECGWPAGWVNILHGGAEIVEALAAADVNAINLTGGCAAGECVSRHAFSKRVLLELGGNDPVIVAEDADVDAAVDVIIAHRFGSSGQRCTSCKRVFAHRSRFDEVVAKLKPRVEALVVGDPSDERTEIGPLISDEAADRVEARVEAYRALGATIHVGGKRERRYYWPTLVTGVDPMHPEALAETFGPVLPVSPYDELQQPIGWTNASPVGLQAGVFTNRLDVAQRLFRELNVGTVVVNQGPNFRIESLPFGGMKEGGFGREGVRFAIEEMTTLKTLVM